MNVAILGASGRLGRMVQGLWPEARYFGRQASGADIDGCDAILDLRGVVIGKGDVFQNVVIAQNALDLGHMAGVRRVFLPSSAAVYGRMGTGLHEEISAPESDYGHSKFEMEQMAAAHAQPATCLRFGNLAGVDAILGGWTPDFTLDQFEDGATPARSYIGPETLVQSLKRLISLDDLPEVLNLAAPGSVEMGALLNAAGLAWRPRPAPKTAIRRVELDTSLLQTFCPISDKAGTAARVAAEWKRVFQAQ